MHTCLYTNSSSSNKVKVTSALRFYDSFWDQPPSLPHFVILSFVLYLSTRYFLVCLHLLAAPGWCLRAHIRCIFYFTNRRLRLLFLLASGTKLSSGNDKWGWFSNWMWLPPTLIPLKNVLLYKIPFDISCVYDSKDKNLSVLGISAYIFYGCESVFLNVLQKEVIFFNENCLILMNGIKAFNYLVC